MREGSPGPSPTNQTACPKRFTDTREKKEENLDNRLRSSRIRRKGATITERRGIKDWNRRKEEQKKIVYLHKDFQFYLK